MHVEGVCGLRMHVNKQYFGFFNAQIVASLTFPSTCGRSDAPQLVGVATPHAARASSRVHQVAVALTILAARLLLFVVTVYRRKYGL